VEVDLTLTHWPATPGAIASRRCQKQFENKGAAFSASKFSSGGVQVQLQQVFDETNLKTPTSATVDPSHQREKASTGAAVCESLLSS
jgi:hypothetical protein